MSKMSAKARLRSLLDWRRSLGIKTKDEKRPQNNRKPRNAKFQRSA
tara:strand:- start:174 stop:311 length:138 start_codon:yes stop_codon:yes gene_type:complete